MQKVFEMQDSASGGLGLLSLTGLHFPSLQMNGPGSPLARHQLVEVHETVLRSTPLLPLGGAAASLHALPFQVVTRPAWPLLEELPTAMHQRGDKHETLSRSSLRITLAGTLRDDHFVPFQTMA
jgi:hypothetical protein